MEAKPKKKAAPAPAARKAVAKKAPIQLPKIVNEVNEISYDDKLVCDYGKNLGLLRNGNTCRGTFRSKCEYLIKRQPHIPRKKPIAYLTRKAVKSRSRELRKTLKTHKKKKWTLRSRILRFRKHKKIAARKKKIYRQSSKKLAQKPKKNLTRKERRLLRLRKEASQLVDKMLRLKNWLEETHSIFKKKFKKKQEEGLNSKEKEILYLQLEISVYIL
jgi:hypothetical protein